MTAILVVLTIGTFLLVEWTRGRRSARVAAVKARPAAQWAPECPQQAAGIFYGAGHTWARIEPDGSVRVGLDDFARRLVGRFERIETAPEGAALQRRDAAFVVHQGTKSAGFAAPIEGVVTAVNTAALAAPANVAADPYGDGWLMTLQPRRLAADLRSLRIGAEVETWMREEVARLRDFLATHVPADAVGATLQDGGAPADGLLEHLDAAAWEKFEAEFLAS